MSRKSKIQALSIVFVLIIIVCVYLGIKLYNAPSAIDVNTVKTEQSISSNKLIALFATNENYANTTYVEKVITVKGVVKDVTYLNDRYTVILQGNNKFSQIICDMSLSDSEKIKKLRTGQQVNIKGICKGYLLDVIMLNCILADE
ncbi:hypothetical protein D7030_02900 [Flavobacteriaceae bacterium AU392]|nr:hypothetical protein D1817_09375 [Flavobacteriaceae bacterium]RKM85635.1 hypothetical protein D7030_02900 [Flavobacteriaceae bacterium AU392]